MHVTTLPDSVNTLIVGAGQAGLVLSGMLSRADHEHLLLEARDSLGGSWQDRWDSFTIVTPNRVTSLPGFPYDGPDPDGFMGRDQIAGRTARYADVVAAPVALSTRTERVVPIDGRGFSVHTPRGTIRANQVVVATGSYHQPRVPAFAQRLPSRVTQLHSHDYRNEGLLPPGAVLVVGSAQTGVQLAEELMPPVAPCTWRLVAPAGCRDATGGWTSSVGSSSSARRAPTWGSACRPRTSCPIRA